MPKRASPTIREPRRRQCRTEKRRAQPFEHLHHHGSFARAVELAEVDALPGPEDQFALLDQGRSGTPHERTLDVRIAVPLGVPEAGHILGDVPVQPQEHVVDHIRVGVLLDGDRGRGMRAINDAHAGLQPFISNRVPHVRGDLDEFRTPVCPDPERGHVRPLWPHAVFYPEKANRNGGPRMVSLFGLPVVAVALAVAAQVESPEYLVKRAVAASGGEKVLAKYPAGRVVGKGTMTFAGVETSFTCEQSFQVPGQLRTVVRCAVKGRKWELVQVMNGDKAAQTLNGRAAPVVESGLKELQHAALLKRSGPADADSEGKPVRAETRQAGQGRSDPSRARLLGDTARLRP